MHGTHSKAKGVANEVQDSLHGAIIGRTDLNRALTMANVNEKAWGTGTPRVRAVPNAIAHRVIKARAAVFGHAAQTSA